MTTTEPVRLAGYTTLGLGGPAAQFVRAEDARELAEAVRAADARAEPVLVLGGGSNVVIADEGFPGLVVLADGGGVQITAAGDAVLLTAAAGQDWDELVGQCVADGLSGIECLSGIPGKAGATPIQNVNAYGQDVAHTITSVAVYDRLADTVAELAAEECGFGYRSSVFKRPAAAAAARGGDLNPAAATGRFVVLSVTFRLERSPLSAPVRYGELSRLLGLPEEGGRAPLTETRAAVLSLRRGKGMVLDPADPDTRSVGSFFTNPVISAARYAELLAKVAADEGGDVHIPHWPEPDGRVKVSAAWLIERAGFSRGFRLAGEPDGARVSGKHTLALTNPGQATTAGLMRLARQIKTGVTGTFGIELVPEPVLVGVSI